jgi:hypothetical protein
MRVDKDQEGWLLFLERQFDSMWKSARWPDSFPRRTAITHNQEIATRDHYSPQQNDRQRACAMPTDLAWILEINHGT